MKNRPVALLLGLLLCAGGTHAQVYKWVGPNGAVNYGDFPPPSTAVPSQKKNFAGNVVDTGDLPFALAEPMKNHPVTLYTSAKCPPCDEGRKLLNARGVPFAEKTITSNADIAMLGKGSAQLPQLVVGRDTQQGFETGIWNARLTAAGYPESSKLPQSFRNPAPRAAAPQADAEAGTGSTGTSGTTSTASGPGPDLANPARRSAAKPKDSTVPALRF